MFIHQSMCESKLPCSLSNDVGRASQSYELRELFIFDTGKWCKCAANPRPLDDIWSITWSKKLFFFSVFGNLSESCESNFAFKARSPFVAGHTHRRQLSRAREIIWHERSERKLFSFTILAINRSFGSVEFWSWNCSSVARGKRKKTV